MYNTVGLSPLLFTVGHVAIKQIVHLELCELDFKRRKQEKERTVAAAKGPRSSLAAGTTSRKSSAQHKSNTPAAEEEDADELDLIGGTTEDDFTEAMAHIRERELLYGPQSLLALFGPMVSEICANNTTYKDRGLQQAATLCLAKLMCVSSEYCEANLPLLITIMERSADATVRSNAVIALGDMAVCFNHLIDENTDFLYRRLADSKPMVKRTCLMTLTFLILAGQVKVKGQLGEMAKCLEDEDKRIADLARMFFTELSTKDNAVYNHFVDMFSLLSADRGMEEESFRRVVKFLLGFVEKVSLPTPVIIAVELVLTLPNNRTSMRSSLLRSWPRGWRGAIPSGSGMMLLLRWACCSTRMRISRSWSRRGSSMCRSLLEMVVGCCVVC
jgi:condensin complex subunit 1